MALSDALSVADGGTSDAGVFGTFEEPKEANAPEPSPKAEEPPTVGEATIPLPEVMVLKGFLVP